MPMSPRSMAGYVALHVEPLRIDDVYDPPAGSPYGFDRSLRREDRLPHQEHAVRAADLAHGRGDRRHPAHQQEARSGAQAAHGQEDVDDQVVPFDERSEALL
jgi:hypothetical protein